MIDIDHFKMINDTHGHDVGDDVIRGTADRLLENVRGNDVAGRWGGEEFLVLLPDTDEHAAMDVAERIRRSIEGMPSGRSTPRLQVTASVGVAVSVNGDRQDLLLAADVALYAAKSAGRNRIEVAGSPAAVPVATPVPVVAAPVPVD